MPGIPGNPGGGRPAPPGAPGGGKGRPPGGGKGRPLGGMGGIPLGPGGKGGMPGMPRPPGGAVYRMLGFEHRREMERNRRRWWWTYVGGLGETGREGLQAYLGMVEEYLTKQLD